MIARPPHILITTPESLYILLTAERSRQMLNRAHTVIVDEIHAVAGDKRGAHLALSLERLDALAGRPLQRIGLSATQKPMEDIACLLVGARRLKRDGTPKCAIVDVGHKRELDLFHRSGLDQELGPITSHALWAEVYDRIVQQIQTHRTTLVFVHTRRLVERVAHQLTDRLGEGKGAGPPRQPFPQDPAGSRAEAQGPRRYRWWWPPRRWSWASTSGTWSWCATSAPPAPSPPCYSEWGARGHWLGAIPKGILYPLTRDDLLQCASAVYAVRRGELDRIGLVRQPLDVLAQQMVATVASLTPAPKPGETLPLLPESGPPRGIAEEDLWELVRGAYPFRGPLARRFRAGPANAVRGGGAGQGPARRPSPPRPGEPDAPGAPRRPSRVHHQRRRHPPTPLITTCRGAQRDLRGQGQRGLRHRELAGDIFLLGNTSWRIQRVASGKCGSRMRTERRPPSPFWLGEARDAPWNCRARYPT